LSAEATTGPAAPRHAASAEEATAGPLGTHEGPYFGDFGGRFVPEALIAALDELDTEYH